MLREINLAVELSKKTSYMDVDSNLLTQLYSVSCDVVPLSKMLLHAETIFLQSVAYDDLGKKLMLLMSANVAIEAKPPVKTADLVALSKSFKSLVELLGGDYFRNGLELSLISKVLGETTVHIQKNIVGNSSESFSHFSILLGQTDALGRNPLHALALSGSTPIIHHLRTLYETLETSDENFMFYSDVLKKALTSDDIRGASPLTYARIRWQNSEFYDEFALFSSIFNVYIDDNGFDMIPFSTSEDPEAVKRRSQRLQEAIDSQSVAGWGIDRLNRTYDEDPIRCDIEEIWELPDPAEFFQNFLSKGKPVVIRSGAHEKLKATFHKKSFIDNYGAYSLPVASIPYAQSFGIKAKVISLSEAAADNAESLYDVARRSNETKMSCAATPNVLLASDHLKSKQEPLKAMEEPLYVFSTADSQWRDKLDAEAPMPRECLRQYSFMTPKPNHILAHINI